MEVEYIAERSTGYPWRFFYNWASDTFAGELEEFTHNPRGYLESMCWNPDEWLPKINVKDVKYTTDDVVKLAGILKKYFNRAIEEDPDEWNATMEALYSDEAEDFIANTMASCIIPSVKA